MPNVSLHEYYTQDTGRVFATGTQALVRLLLEQKRRDRQAGLNTRGLVSGYSGSLLGRLDHAGLDRDHFGSKAARALHRAMAIKDEAEVARLLTSLEFQQNVTKKPGPQPKSFIILRHLFFDGSKIETDNHANYN